MKRSRVIALGSVALGAALVAGSVLAQSPQPMPHDVHHQHHPAGGGQIMPGQDAFGAMAEVVRILEADPTTDWSKVDMERLRQHLIDMNEVVLRASVKATQVPGGLSMDVTGEGRTARSIQAMVVPQAAQLGAMPAWSAKAEPIP